MKLLLLDTLVMGQIASQLDRWNVQLTLLAAGWLRDEKLFVRIGVEYSLTKLLLRGRSVNGLIGVGHSDELFTESGSSLKKLFKKKNSKSFHVFIFDRLKNYFFTKKRFR